MTTPVIKVPWAVRYVPVAGKQNLVQDSTPELELAPGVYRLAVDWNGAEGLSLHTRIDGVWAERVVVIPPGQVRKSRRGPLETIIVPAGKKASVLLFMETSTGQRVAPSQTTLSQVCAASLTIYPEQDTPEI